MVANWYWRKGNVNVFIIKEKAILLRMVFS